MTDRITQRMLRNTDHRRPDRRNNTAQKRPIPNRPIHGPHQPPRPNWVPEGRTLHLIDIENLVGSGRCHGEVIQRATRLYRKMANVKPKDHAIIGCNKSLALDVHASWSGCQVVCGQGKDGADLAILRVSNARDIAQKYHRVIVGSGDGIFSHLAGELRALGVPVWVVSRRKATARELERQATIVMTFPVLMNESNPGRGEAA